MTYFVYLCFSHLRHCFVFKFVDRMAVGVSVGLLFGLVVFGLGFYLLVFRYLGKKASYFS